MKAAPTPNPASIPKDLNAAIPEVRLAINATIVVIEVNRIAFPTLLIDISADFSKSLPFRLSSLYR